MPKKLVMPESDSYRPVPIDPRKFVLNLVNEDNDELYAINIRHYKTGKLIYDIYSHEPNWPLALKVLAKHLKRHPRAPHVPDE